MKLAVITSITSAVACMAMLGVTISLLRGGPEAATGAARSDADAPAAAGPRRSAVPGPSSEPPRFAALGARARFGTPDESVTEREPDSVPKAVAANLNPTGAASPALEELAARLNLNPAALTKFVGADGQVPTAVVARLERTADAGKGLARRLDLDETKTQVFSDLFLSQTIGVLELEQRNGGQADPEQIEALTQDTLAGIRVVGGPRAVSEAEEALGSLR